MGSAHHQAQFVEIEFSSGTPRMEGAAHYLGGHTVSPAWRDRPQGLWGEWTFDGKTLVARNDPLGFFPLFYHFDGSKLILSPCLQTVARRCGTCEIDPVAFSVFMCLGFFIGDETAFAGINCLPPAATLTFDGKLEITGGPWRGPQCSIGIEEATEGYVDLVREAVARRHPGDRVWGMPLSGGRDSRFLLFSLLHQNTKPKCCVSTRQYPPRSNVDAEVASGLTSALGIRHVILDPMSRFRAEREKNRRTHFLADEHAWFVSVADYMQEEVEATYDGLGGGTLTGHWLRMPWRKAYESGALDQVAEMLVPAGAGLSGTLGVRPDWITDLDAVRGRIVAELARYEGTLSPVTEFMFWNRTRREIGLMATTMIDRIPAYAPFLDTDLYEFLSGIPPEVMGVNVIQERAFELGFPEWKDLPFSPYRTSRNAILHYAGFCARMLGYSATSGSLGLGAALRYPLRLAQCLASGDKVSKRVVSPARVLFNVQLAREIPGLGE